MPPVRLKTVSDPRAVTRATAWLAIVERLGADDMA